MVGFGTIKAGRVAAVRIKTSAYVAVREAIVVEHVNRMWDDIAPEWKRADSHGCTRVEIEGDPNIAWNAPSATVPSPKSCATMAI